MQTNPGIKETYAKLGACVDEFERNLLEVSSAGMDHKTLAQRDNAFFCARDRSLQHEVVILDNTVVRESTHGCDRFGCGVMLSRGILLIFTRTNAVDFLVELSAVMIPICAET